MPADAGGAEAGGAEAGSRDAGFPSELPVLIEASTLDGGLDTGFPSETASFLPDGASGGARVAGDAGPDGGCFPCEAQ